MARQAHLLAAWPAGESISQVGRLLSLLVLPLPLPLKPNQTQGNSPLASSQS